MAESKSLVAKLVGDLRAKPEHAKRKIGAGRGPPLKTARITPRKAAPAHHQRDWMDDPKDKDYETGDDEEEEEEEEGEDGEYEGLEAGEEVELAMKADDASEEEDDVEVLASTDVAGLSDGWDKGALPFCVPSDVRAAPVSLSTLHQIALNVRRKLAREREGERRRWLEKAFQKVKDSLREAVNRGSLRATAVIWDDDVPCEAPNMEELLEEKLKRAIPGIHPIFQRRECIVYLGK